MRESPAGTNPKCQRAPQTSGYQGRAEARTSSKTSLEALGQALEADAAEIKGNAEVVA
jgi:hypothetical protein